MTRFKKGDTVIITEGDFTGQWGVIVDKDIIGDELTVALAENGGDIRTHEAHVNKVDRD
jgi:ribosomal protein L24